MAHPYNEILLINMMNEPQKHDVTIYCMVLLMSLKRQNVETESRSYVGTWAEIGIDCKRAGSF